MQRDTDTQGRRPRKDRGRDWCGAAISQEMLRIPRSQQKLQEARRVSPLQVSEGEWDCKHLDFGLLAFTAMKEYVLL